jgi:hypothetical protein
MRIMLIVWISLAALIAVAAIGKAHAADDSRASYTQEDARTDAITHARGNVTRIFKEKFDIE